jgi:hypothetical protein
MNRNAACIDCRDSGGCNYDIFLVGFAHKIVQESSFPGSGFSGEKNTAVRMFG